MLDWVASFIAINIGVILPICILFVSFIIKLSVERSVKLPHFVAAAFELPVDVMIISITVVSTVIIANPAKKESIAFLFAYLIISIVCAICWRKSVECLDAGTGAGNKEAFLISGISYFLAALCLFLSISLIAR